MNVRRVMIVGGPWPERIGAVGWEVAPDRGARKVYPWAGLPRSEVVVLLDDDPLPAAPGPLGGRPRGWSCVIGRADVSPFDGETL